jgi:hypothetical protein
MGVDDTGPLFIDFSTRKLKTNIMIQYKLMRVKNYAQLLTVKD